MYKLDSEEAKHPTPYGEYPTVKVTTTDARSRIQVIIDQILENDGQWLEVIKHHLIKKQQHTKYFLLILYYLLINDQIWSKTQ